LPKHVALSNPEKPKSPISSFFEDPRFDNEVILTSFKSGLSYGTFFRLQKYIYFQFLQLYFLLIVLFHEKSLNAKVLAAFESLCLYAFRPLNLYIVFM
jgi:hypothetical protein